MDREQKREQIRDIKSAANSPKHRLIDIMAQLEDIGAKREAKSLGVIIEKLEIWQNK